METEIVITLAITKFSSCLFFYNIGVSSVSYQCMELE